MKKKILYTICVLTFISGFAHFAFANMGSESFRIPTSVLSGGGTAMNSANFQINGTLGQPSPLMDTDYPPGSGNYGLFSGFWYTIDAVGSVEKTTAMNLSEGWSMVSLPVMIDNALVQEVFPGAVVVYGFIKGSGYVRLQNEDELVTGSGYWILLNEEKMYTLTGQTIKGYTFSLNEDGWHMIGGCTNPAQVSIDNGNIDVIYGYAQGSGYQRLLESEDLEPGKGYWILFSGINGQANIDVE